MRNQLILIFSILTLSLHAQSLDKNFTASVVPKEAMTTSQLDAIVGNATSTPSITISTPRSNENFAANQSITLSPGAHLTGSVSLKIENLTLVDDDFLSSITYYDGLGRPIQDVAIRQTPNGKDIVQHYEYDEAGRSSKSYLPFPTTQNSGNFVENPIGLVTTYYDDKYGDSNPYAQRRFELSPLNRVEEIAEPGESWKLNPALSTDHTKKLSYSTNSKKEVNFYSINSDGTLTSGFYDENELSKNTIKNENWQPSDGKLNTKEIFTDKNGRIIAEVIYEDNGSTLGNSAEKLVTNYIYDDLGRLKFILPPKASARAFGELNASGSFSWNYTKLLPDYFPGGGGGSASASIQNNILRISASAGFNSSTLKEGRIAFLHSGIPNIELGLIIPGVQASSNYLAYIEDGYFCIKRNGYPTSVTTLGFSFEVPVGNISFPTDNEVVLDLAYQYEYDDYNREIGQKVPGKKWEYVIYDQLDRPILTQDANLRANNLWLFTKFDAFGRVVYSGKYSSTKSRKDLQTDVDNFFSSSSNKSNIEKRQSSSVSIGGVSINYSNNAFPTTGITEVLGVNYFDDYNFNDPNKPNTPTNIEGQAVTTKTKGLPTANWIKTLGSNSWTKSYIYYDKKGRSIKTYTKNYLGGFTSLASKLDFRGKTIENITEHKKVSNSNLLTVTDNFDYDHSERVIAQHQKINDQQEEHIASYEYDELGMLYNKGVGGISSTNPLQNIAYKYNIRGWLTEINNVDNLGDDLFAFKIKYDQTAEGQASALARYNGNASQTIWRSKFDNSKRAYSYTYDNLNRLKIAEYVQGNNLNESLGLYSTTISGYDANGNILGLSRKGVNPNTSAPTTIDALQYKYDNGNRLINIQDTALPFTGFTDRNNALGDYEYDDNGNLIKDGNREISKIHYNHLDLVSRIDFTDGKQLLFTYNSAGEKLAKTYVAGGSPKSTYYLSGFQYENNTLKFFPISEGYAYNTSSSNNHSFKYAYTFTDHIGNVRLSYTDTNSDNTITTNEIISNSGYYPLGMIHSGQLLSGIASSYSYSFQGKEMQNEHNLGIYDFGSRMYYPGLGRWMNTDPQNQFGSPYLAMGNNWIIGIDPNGEIFVIDDVIVGLVTGIGNVVGQAIAGNIDSWGDGFAYFGIGFGAGLTATYTGGLGTAAILAAGNSAYGQYDQTGTIDPTQLLFDTGFGALTAGVGNYFGGVIQTQFSGAFSGIKNQLLRDLTVQMSAQATTGFVLGTGFSLATGNSLEDSFDSGLQGFATGLATGALTAAHQNTTKYINKQQRAQKIEEIKTQRAEQAQTQNNPTTTEQNKPRALTLGEMDRIAGGDASNISLNYDRLQGPSYREFSGTVKPNSGTGTPNSVYEYLTPNGKPISRHFYNDSGKVEFEINFKPHNMRAVHGHFNSIPGNISSGHLPQNHVPFVKIPLRFW